MDRPAAICHVLQVQETGETGLAEVAAAQQGVVERGQLYALGIGRGSIAHRLTTGRLHPLFPGVFSIGYLRRDTAAARIAALLYAGDNALFSHGTAAAMWRLAPEPEGVQVTLAGRHIREPASLRVHRVAEIDLRDVRVHDGLPLTAPARTLLDFSAEASEEDVMRAIAQARIRRLVSDRDLGGAMARAPGRSGVQRLRHLLAQEAGRAPTRSAAERRLLALVAEAQLPAPEANARLLGYEVDFLWRRAKLVLEIDGFAFHGHRGAFEADRRRDQVLTAAGYRVIRVTWRQLVDEPLAVAARLAQSLLAARLG